METDSSTPPAAPEIAIQNFNGLIDDRFVTSCQNRIPFYWPSYADQNVGDQVLLLANGTLIFFGTLPESALSGRPTFTVDGNAFDYTGRCNLHFQIVDIMTHNPALSDSRVYTVQRNAYPAPDDPKGIALTAPVISPLKYDKKSYDGKLALSVSIAYEDMKTTDAVTLKFELRKTTANYRGPVPLFYDVPDIPVPIGANDAAAGKVTVSLPAGIFQGVDENIASVYYVVRSMPVDSNARYLDMESRRNLTFQVDVVPPYSA
ncbi:hypothetical protein CAL29_25895 [Bordetella genomosp. 10]|uniref:Uncharacterized protein n=1 Tax=Bordetella genomosp. 10 TaxID=1416804 RepID=A0A261S2H6_9BORD|nr:hypothetical protein [Bordetella genomosp. 10]OZI31351.1 hypothetical protein CAL29_25895 [Bordetella genomosp. 10]